MMFMMVHFVIERWREALLWSWTVARNGRIDDKWDQEIDDLAWEELGGDISTHESISVRAVYRDSLEHQRVAKNLKASGYTGEDPTIYVFSTSDSPFSPLRGSNITIASQDGYPYVNFIDGMKNQWPKYSRDVEERNLPRCTIDYRECFTDQGQSFSQASEIFKNVAFRHPRCGDCSQFACAADHFATADELIQ